MQPSTFATLSLLSFWVLARPDICEDPQVKSDYSGDCEAFLYGERDDLTMEEIHAVGTTSGICKKISIKTADALNERIHLLDPKKHVLDILPFICIRDMLDGQPTTFNHCYKQLNEPQKHNLFRRIKMCFAIKKYEGTAAEHDLKKYCRENKFDLEAEKEKLKQRRMEIEKKRDSSADNLTFTAACIFIPIVAAAALI
jgi:hypothetical protein